MWLSVRSVVVAVVAPGKFCIGTCMGVCMYACIDMYVGKWAVLFSFAFFLSLSMSVRDRIDGCLLATVCCKVLYHVIALGLI